LLIRLGFVLRPLLRTHLLLLTLTPACSCVYICKFQFRPIHPPPPLGDYQTWYECLRDFLITNGFKVRKVDPTLFTKTIAKDLFICQIYVDDIIFGSTNKSSCEEFSSIMIHKFEMSMMGG
jgi:hypothetical protein